MGVSLLTIDHLDVVTFDGEIRAPTDIDARMLHLTPLDLQRAEQSSGLGAMELGYDYFFLHTALNFVSLEEPIHVLGGMPHPRGVTREPDGLPLVNELGPRQCHC